MDSFLSLITAITALVAVVIGPMVSIKIARREIRASVVSANRQVWINNLRDTIAEYLAKQATVRNLNKLKHADDTSISRIEDTVRLNSKIELLINSKEPDHAELLIQICLMTNTLNQQAEKNKDFDVDACRRRIVELSQSILKREWERVKNGD